MTVTRAFVVSEGIVSREGVLCLLQEAVPSQRSFSITSSLEAMRLIGAVTSLNTLDAGEWKQIRVHGFAYASSILVLLESTGYGALRKRQDT